MNIFLQFFLFFVLIFQTSSQSTNGEIYKNYVKKFRVTRSQNVFNNVIRNHRSIFNHNKRFEQGLETFNQSLNEFSQLTLEDFSKFKLGALEDEPNEKRVIKLCNGTDGRRGRAVDPPASFLWPESVVGKVKNQGSCGSCYAFTAVNVIKAKLAIRYGTNAFDLSEQDAMECSRGCSGGWDYSVYRDYSQKYNGMAAYNYGSIHSYTGKSYGCYTTSRPKVPNTRVKAYYSLPVDEEAIKYALVNQGPLYTRFDVYENFYQYSRGIYSSASGSFLGGHAVVLVGYGVENGVKYWIIKNSWDTWWGEKGYFRMLRGKNLCGIEGRVSYVEI